MVLTIAKVCQLVALVLFLLAAFGIPARINLLALGLAVWMFALLIA